jgi:hypothetical protein
MRLKELIYFSLSNSLDYPKAFLQKAINLFAFTLELVAAIIREFSPALSDFPFRLLPFARNLIPIHDGPLANGCHRPLIWGLGPIKIVFRVRNRAGLGAIQFPQPSISQSALRSRNLSGDQGDWERVQIPCGLAEFAQ